MEDIIKRITTARKNLNLNQEEFNKELGLPKGVISKIEASNRKIDSATLLALHERFEISPNWILLGLGEPTKSKGSTEEELKKENAWLKEQLSKALSANEDADKYKRDLIDIYKLLNKAGLSIKELANIIAAKQAV